jgi:hypothetical protein
MRTVASGIVGGWFMWYAVPPLLVLSYLLRPAKPTLDSVMINIDPGVQDSNLQFRRLSATVPRVQKPVALVFNVAEPLLSLIDSLRI